MILHSYFSNSPLSLSAYRVVPTDQGSCIFLTSFKAGHFLSVMQTLLLKLNAKVLAAFLAQSSLISEPNYKRIDS